MVLRARLNTTDEYQFLVNKEQAKQAAYLMQMAHAWCWSLVLYNCGICDYPISYAFASAINIDKTWRKNAFAKTATPTFYDIPPGKEYNVYQLIDEAEASNYWNMDDLYYPASPT